MNLPLTMESRREMFVDSYLIDVLKDVRPELKIPQPAGTAIEFDNPWEGVHCGYVTVVNPGDKYQMYFRGMPDDASDEDNTSVTCYVESTDGIHWTKPDVGLHEINGAKKNNVRLMNDSPYLHNLSPFIDARPSVPADERYKALGGVSGIKGLAAFASADGIRWRVWDLGRFTMICQTARWCLTRRTLRSGRRVRGNMSCITGYGMGKSARSAGRRRRIF